MTRPPVNSSLGAGSHDRGRRTCPSTSLEPDRPMSEDRPKSEFCKSSQPSKAFREHRDFSDGNFPGQHFPGFPGHLPVSPRCPGNSRPEVPSDRPGREKASAAHPRQRRLPTGHESHSATGRDKDAHTISRDKAPPIERMSHQETSGQKIPSFQRSLMVLSRPASLLADSMQINHFGVERAGQAGRA